MLSRRQRYSFFSRIVCFLAVLLLALNIAFAAEADTAPADTPAAEAVFTDEAGELTYFDLDQYASEETEIGSEPLDGPPEMLSIPYPSPEAGMPETVASDDTISLPKASSSAKMTVLNLRGKFPEGKYWNHANNPGSEPERSNPDGWTDVPCPFHDDHDDGYYKSGIVTCNVFYLDGVAQGTQCHGFCAKLGYDFSGKSIKEWAVIENGEQACAVVKPGDIIRINNDKHTIFVIAVRNDDIMYVDCNNGHQCAIHWNQRTTKQKILNGFTRMYQAPMTLSWGGEGPCWCLDTEAGQYITYREVPLKDGHGTGSDYSTLLTVPAGATVEVTKGDGRFVHAKYNGKSGFLPASAVYRADTPPQVIPSCTGMNLIAPDGDESYFDFDVYCTGNLPDRFELRTAVSDNTPHFFRLDFLGWDQTTAKCRVTALAGGLADLSFRLVDSSSGKILAANSIRIFAKERTAYLTSTPSGMINLDLEKNTSKTITLTAGGYIPGNTFNFTLWAASGDNFRIDWVGDWHEKSHDVQITAIRPGRARAVFALVSDAGIRASIEVHITVDGEIQYYPDFYSIALSSTERRSLPFTIRFYGNFPEVLILQPSQDTNAFYMEDIDLTADTWTQPLYLKATFIPKETGSGSASFALIDAATKQTVITVRIPVQVVSAPVYLLTYDLTGGANAPTAHLISTGIPVMDNVPTKDHYTFAGWTDNPETNIIRYQPGDPFRGESDMTLYAVWGPRLPGKTLKLPEGTVRIEEEAFAGTDIRSVAINESCVSIAAGAFADNSRLSVVSIPGSKTKIDQDAFSGCGKLTIYGKKGSTAEAFAESKGCTFYPLD